MEAINRNAMNNHPITKPSFLRPSNAHLFVSRLCETVWSSLIREDFGPHLAATAVPENAEGRTQLEDVTKWKSGCWNIFMWKPSQWHQRLFLVGHEAVWPCPAYSAGTQEQASATHRRLWKQQQQAMERFGWRVRSSWVYPRIYKENHCQG